MKNATVAVLLLDNNRILLVLNPKEDCTKPNGEKFIKPEGWGMPRGMVEETDNDEIATAEREAKEETNFSVEIDARYRVEEPAGDHTHIAFIGYPVAGLLKINSELSDAKWFSPRVLWEDSIGLHPRQRRMAQKLIGLQRKSSA